MKFIDGKEDGAFYSYFENGQIQNIGTYQNGDKKGIWKDYHDNGTLKSEIDFQQKPPLKKEFFSNGNLKAKGDISGDEKSGNWAYYYDNGTILGFGVFEKGVQKGDWIFYAENGLKKEIISFSDSRKFIKELDDKEKIIAEGQIADDNKEGKWNYYDDSGLLVGTANFTKGLGEFIGVYEDGSLRSKGKLENNKRVGKWQIYSRTGQLEGNYNHIYLTNPSQGGDIVEEKSLSQNDSSVIVDSSTVSGKFRNFTPKNGEFRGMIYSFNSINALFNNIPASIEYYFQERLGYELMYVYKHNPFFKNRDDLALEEPYSYDHNFKFRQKLYRPAKNNGMIYFGQELDIHRQSFFVNYHDTDASSTFTKAKAIESTWAYGLFLGYKLMMNTGGKGWVFDISVAYDLGIRKWSTKYGENPEIDSFYSQINKEKFYTYSNDYYVAKDKQIPLMFVVLIGLSTSKK